MVKSRENENQKLHASSHPSSLSMGDDPQCFSVHPWRIKLIFEALPISELLFFFCII
jgi:hypothetical protein